MAQSKKVDSTPKKKQPTVAEIRQWYNENKPLIDRFASSKSTEDALKNLRDITKSTTQRTINNYNKETIRTYLQNISSNESNLRNLSRYLFYRCQIYYRLVKYYAGQMDLSIHSVIPNYSLTEDNDKDAILQSYQDTIKTLNEMNCQYEFFKAYVVALREDVAYYCAYYTEGEGMFLLPLDPDYCKIQGMYYDSSFAFAFDCSYFRRNQTLLEYWGEPFQSMYNEYTKTNQKWQSMPPEYAVCLKFRAEDWETVVPPFAPMFIELVNLLDLVDIQAVVDEKQIYNLIWMEMETFNDSNGEPNAFKVDPTVSIPYFNKMNNEAIPDYCSSAIVPGKLNKMTFSDTAASDVNKIESATENILNTSGGAQILNSATISGTTAFTGSMRADSEFAVSSLIPQTQAIVNRLLSFYISNPCKVKYFEVSTFTKGEFQKTLLESAQYGLPTKLMVNSMNGFSEIDTLALNFLEEDVLGLTDKFVPLKSSYTTSASDSESGGQTKDETELTDAGEASQDKKDNAK